MLVYLLLSRLQRSPNETPLMSWRWGGFPCLALIGWKDQVYSVAILWLVGRCRCVPLPFSDWLGISGVFLCLAVIGWKEQVRSLALLWLVGWVRCVVSFPCSDDAKNQVCSLAQLWLTRRTRCVPLTTLIGWKDQVCSLGQLWLTLRTRNASSPSSDWLEGSGVLPCSALIGWKEKQVASNVLSNDWRDSLESLAEFYAHESNQISSNG